MFSNPKGVLHQFHVDPGMSVADFGVGSGYYSLEIADMVGDSGTVYAFDVQKELLIKLKNEASSKGIPNIKTHWTDLDEPNSTKLKDRSIDRVIVANVLFQVENKKVLAEEAKRILKPNGKILVVDWTDSHGGLGPPQSNVVAKEEARKLFTDLGFVIDREINAGVHHYGFVTRFS